MEAMQALLTRRSVRSFTRQPVPEEAIQAILRAAMHAPSSNDERPWHFMIITDRRILDEVPRFHPFAEMLPQVGVAILVCGDELLEKRPGRWMIDCAAATENLLLAAHALGLGAVWMGIYPDPVRVEGMRRLAGLPGNIQPLSLVPIGYPAVASPAVERFDPERIHRNYW
jgi:nitroreductase